MQDSGFGLSLGLEPSFSSLSPAPFSLESVSNTVEELSRCQWDFNYLKSLPFLQCKERMSELSTGKKNIIQDTCSEENHQHRLYCFLSWHSHCLSVQYKTPNSKHLVCRSSEWCWLRILFCHYLLAL